MRACLRFAAAGVLVTCSVIPSVAQSPTSPRTLETLLKQDKEPEPPQPETNTAKQTKAKMQGTYVRPEEGVQHPDLDKAWAAYDYAVTQANGTVTAALTQLFDAAAEKGDLDAADKWQTLRDKFQKEGVLPDEKQVQSVVKAAVQGIKSANDELRDAYDQLVKSLTKEKKIAEAKAVRDEWKTLEKDGDDVAGVVGGKAQRDTTSPVRKPAVKPVKPVKLKPATYRFADENEIKKDWELIGQGWRIENGSLRMMKGSGVRTLKLYEGDFTARIAYRQHVCIKVCGETFLQMAEGTVAIVERHGNMLTVRNNALAPVQVQLKDSQLAATAIEVVDEYVNPNVSFLDGVEIVGTPMQQE